MKIAVDIGGVLSAYPEQMQELLQPLSSVHEIHVITDMHDRAETLVMLKENGFGWIPEERVHNADYARYGEMCKAMILHSLGIDLMLDDFGAYVTWDSQLGTAPMRWLVMPDPFRPYWDKNWKCSGGDFGRRVAPRTLNDGGKDDG